MISCKKGGKEQKKRNKEKKKPGKEKEETDKKKKERAQLRNRTGSLPRIPMDLNYPLGAKMPSMTWCATSTPPELVGNLVPYLSL